MLLLVYGVFFFQEEDGIRYLVRSRGLGNVYKRQRLGVEYHSHARLCAEFRYGCFYLAAQGVLKPDIKGPVSYTHLTLPTSDLV